MVRTRRVYKATGEQLSILDIFRKPSTRKTKSTSIMSADEQITTPSDLAAKVAMLSDDMKTILDWIKTQSAAPSAMRWRRAVEAKIEIPNYDGVVDTEKLDAWLDQLETYFDLYNYSNEEKVFRKYTASLQERINNEFHLFSVRDIASASQTAMAIERKSKLSREEKPSREIDNDAPTLIEWIDQADTSLSLMAMLKETSLCPSSPTDKREELFTFRVQVKNKVIDAIIDPSSQKNLISENLVQRLCLSTTPHPHPYPLGLINGNIEMNIDR
uniref:Retrotransposon gag domain-containing protein n=1 Tax=Ananas comosus var. bracteatus TaxID=296719 RepID=A0A6V7NNZ1_ANACO|nr:unnamed protein product [Ananas comosus var. bracteatus]